jgi:Co/Zn/Cd efflux system component
MTSFRRVVLVVALLNLGYFGVEFAVALAIGSVSLFADSVDFLEDASINLLIFFAAGWSQLQRSRVGSVLAFVILIPALATIWTAVVKILDPSTPEPVPMSLAALGALAVNLSCAFLLVRHRHAEGSMAKAAWLSARNDALANVAIIGVALTSAWIATGWIDIVVGLAIAVLNADAARAVWKAARAERLGPESATP